MKLEVKYIFPTSALSVNNYIYKLSEGLGMTKYQHMVLGYKRLHKQGKTLSGFSQIFMELCGSKVELTPPDRNFINGITNPEIVH